MNGDAFNPAVVEKKLRLEKIGVDG